MNIIVSHPTSNQNNRALVKGMLEAQLLYEFHTSVAVFPDDLLNKLSSIRPFRELSRRCFEPELKTLTKTAPFMEIGRILTSKLGIQVLNRDERNLFSIDSIYQNLDKKVAGRLKEFSNKELSAIYAYEDCAYHSFIQAKAMKLPCLYDLPIGYWRAAKRLLQNEIERWPDWASTLTGFKDSESKLERKDKELALADTIFVASSFTAKTLEEYPGKLSSINVIPYGFPKPVENRQYSIGKRPLKLLFVGG